MILVNNTFMHSYSSWLTKSKIKISKFFFQVIKQYILFCQLTTTDISLIVFKGEATDYFCAAIKKNWWLRIEIFEILNSNDSSLFFSRKLDFAGSTSTDLVSPTKKYIKTNSNFWAILDKKLNWKNNIVQCN